MLLISALWMIVVQVAVPLQMTHWTVTVFLGCTTGKPHEHVARLTKTEAFGREEEEEGDEDDEDDEEDAVKREDEFRSGGAGCR